MGNTQLEELKDKLGAILFEIGNTDSDTERKTLENIYSNKITHLTEAIQELEQK
jgi:hypothetical protein|tara:strand:- start:238 stop:399 length:162 start_codon:yes stop_codon:yes gene_type:complete